MTIRSKHWLIAATLLTLVFGARLIRAVDAREPPGTSCKNSAGPGQALLPPEATMSPGPLVGPPCAAPFE